MKKTYVTEYYTGKQVSAYLVCEEGTGRTLLELACDLYTDAGARAGAKRYSQGWNAAASQCETSEGLERWDNPDSGWKDSGSNITGESAGLFDTAFLYGTFFTIIILFIALIIRANLS